MMVVAAAAWGWPTTFGTVTGPATCDRVALEREERRGRPGPFTTTSWRPSWAAAGVHWMRPEVGSIAIPAGAVGSENVRMSPASGSAAWAA